MSLMLLLVSPALADRVLWVEPPDEASAAAVARTLPGSTSASLDSLVTGGVGQLKREGIATLRRELAEVRPLADEFDGELKIMSRLAKATDDVDILASQEERDLLRSALLFQGFAVHRYFQGRLGTEAAAAPYRMGTGADAWVSAWVDAGALLAAPTAVSDADVPEPAERLALDETQAHTSSMPSATFLVAELAAGAEVRIDGVKIEGGPGIRVRVIPGRHLFHVAVGDTLLLAQDVRIKAGADAIIRAPFGPTELAELKGRVAEGADGWEIPLAARMPIEGMGEPVYIATPDGEKTTLLRVDGAVASQTPLKRSEAESKVALVGRATVGGGWVSSGDFLLQNLDEGATADKYTVNAGTPAAQVSVALEGALWSVGVGLDAQFSMGEYHSLPTGDVDTSVFLYPHVAGGLPWVQATIGPLFPWYLGLGGQARIPLFKPVELYAAGVYGLPIDLDRGAGEPEFEPQPLYSAWGGVSVRFGG